MFGWLKKNSTRNAHSDSQQSVPQAAQHEIRNAIQGLAYERRQIVAALARQATHAARIEAALRGDSE